MSDNNEKPVATLQQAPAPVNPFAKDRLPSHANIGAIAIESERAVAEAQGKLVIAKRFPRDEAKAFQRFMDACSRPALAAVAMYSYPKGGQKVSGPSIRIAEEGARCWGNIDYGIRELSRNEQMSEMEAYCWDMETNVISSQKFTVRHIIDTQGGGRSTRDEREVYELTANMGGRRLRARIMAILPPDLIEAAIEQCRKTLAGSAVEPIGDRIRKMVAAFGKLGVPAGNIEKYLSHPLDNTTADELVDLLGIYQSVKDGMTKPSDWFSFENTLASPTPLQSPTSHPGQPGPASTVAAPETPAPKRERGKPSPGHQKRTKVEMEEDRLAEEAEAGQQVCNHAIESRIRNEAGLVCQACGEILDPVAEKETYEQAGPDGSTVIDGEETEYAAEGQGQTAQDEPTAEPEKKNFQDMF